MLSQRSTNPSAFEQLRPKLAEWNHFLNALRRAGRIRSKEYSVKAVILVLGKIKDAEAYDISDQICLAYGHTAMGRSCSLRAEDLTLMQSIPWFIQEACATKLLRSGVCWTRKSGSFPIEMHAFQAASVLCAIDLGGTYAVAYSALIEQSQAFGHVIQDEVDEASGVFRKMRVRDSVDVQQWRIGKPRDPQDFSHCSMISSLPAAFESSCRRIHLENRLCSVSRSS